MDFVYSKICISDEILDKTKIFVPEFDFIKYYTPEDKVNEKGRFVGLGYPHSHGEKLGDILRNNPTQVINSIMSRNHKGEVIKESSEVMELTEDLLEKFDNVSTLIPKLLIVLPYQNNFPFFWAHCPAAMFFSGSPILAKALDAAPKLVGIALATTTEDKPGPYKELTAKELKKWSHKMKGLNISNIDRLLENDVRPPSISLEFTDFKHLVLWQPEDLDEMTKLFLKKD